MKRTKTWTLLTLLVIVCVVATCALVACKKDEITLSYTQLDMQVGDSITVSASVPSGYDTPTWKVEPQGVVELTPFTSNIYTVEAKSVGRATITVTSGNLSATCAVNVTEKEVVTITLDGEAVTSASVKMGETLQLAASSNKGSAITAWKSSNEKIATVSSNGLVTGVRASKDPVTITAQVTASVKAEVQLLVTSDSGYEYYEIELRTEFEPVLKLPGVWEIWTQWGQFTERNYDNGTVNLEFTENAGANWYNIQLFHVDSSIDAGKYYKMLVDIDSNAAGHVTINGNVIALQEGKHTYEAYFTNGDGFSMQFGVEGGKPIIDIPEAKVAISNIRYEEDTDRVQLVAPNFEYDDATGVITIIDDNTAGVKNYVLALYQDGKRVAGVTLDGSGEVDWSMVESGTYQATIQAIALNSHYDSSPESAVQTITVENDEGIRYEFHNKDGDTTAMDPSGATAKQTPGIWTYWTNSWVTIEGVFNKGILTVEFSNNTGVWSDTQLFYKHPGLEKGKEYIMKIEIDSDAEGRVTLNDEEFMIEQTKKVYNIVFTEDGGTSIALVFGLNGKDKEQEIPAATISFEIKSVTELQRTALATPDFELEADNVVKIIDTENDADTVAGYELGFFQGGELKKTITAVQNEAIDLSKIPGGTYQVKIRAVAYKNSEYSNSEWSDTQYPITSESTRVDIENGEEGDELKTPGTWIEWHDQGWVGANITLDEATVDGDGTVTISYTSTGSNWFGLQMWYKSTETQDNVIYALTMKINSTVEGSITINSVVVPLVVGVNNVDVGFKQIPGKATIAIQFGVSTAGTMISGGTFTMSDISFAVASTGTLSAPSFSLNSSNVITIEDSNTAGVASYELGFFIDNAQKTSVTVENNKEVDLSQVPAGTYTVKLRAVGKDIRYTTSGWSTTTATITSTNGTIKIEYSGETAFTSGWRYWNDPAITVSECYLDASTNKVYLTYSGKNQWYGMQLFYKSDERITKVTIKSSVNGQITICGQKVPLVADQEVSVNLSNYKSGNGSAIDIQFGIFITESNTVPLDNGGTFEISYTVAG